MTEPVDPSRARALRRRVFWAGLTGVLLALAAAHGVERGMRYDLGDGLRHGSYGFELARVPPKRARTPRVVLLGNSVYQAQTGRLIRDLAREAGTYVLITGSIYLVGELLGLLTPEEVPGPVSM